MSTTFAIRIERDDEDEFPNGYEYVEVAFRSRHHSRWMNPLAHLLPDETEIVPMNNSHQGIFTIGDFKKLLSE